MTDKEQLARYRLALQDLAEYCPYGAARQTAKAALDLSQPLKVSVPKRHTTKV